jgi:hypothetical protein
MCFFNIIIQQVLHHGERKFGDTHRFATTEDPEDFASKVRLDSQIIFLVNNQIIIGTSLCCLE